MREHLQLLATYNEWMNLKLYAAAAQLPAAELAANKGAFFGSLLGTLNHIMVGDRIWLARFATHPARHASLEGVRALPVPTSLDQILFEDFKELDAHRKWLDTLIKQWAAELTDEDLRHLFRYANTKGVVSVRRFSSVLLHLFNHQTHHRGQATTLLSQAGIDVGATDLLMLVPDEVARA
jgi:uncharacterized damage-inducible protein DinB